MTNLQPCYVPGVFHRPPDFPQGETCCVRDEARNISGVFCFVCACVVLVEAFSVQCFSPHCHVCTDAAVCSGEVGNKSFPAFAYQQHIIIGLGCPTPVFVRFQVCWCWQGGQSRRVNRWVAMIHISNSHSPDTPDVPQSNELWLHLQAISLR